MTGLDDMDDLERALVDLGAHLDQPAADELAANVVAALEISGSAPTPRHTRPRRRRGTLLAAAAVVVAAFLLLAITPTRQAIAQFFGIGTVEFTREPVGPATGTQPVPGARPTNTRPATALEDARRQLGFAIRLPTAGGIGDPLRVEVDDRAPGGLLAVAYPDFTVIEVASPPGEAPVLGKSIQPGTHIDQVDVAGNPGVWLTGDPHSIGYLGRDGELRLDTTRRAGNVLVWTADGMTYRIEGVSELADSLAVAASMT